MGVALERIYKIKMNLIKPNLFISAFTLQYILNAISRKIINESGLSKH